MVETSVSFIFIRVMLDKMNLFGEKCGEIWHQMSHNWQIVGYSLL